MHIAHLGKYYFPIRGGIETAVKDLAEVAVSFGHQVTCIVANNKNCSSHENIQNVYIIRLSTLFQKFSTPFCFGYFFTPLKQYSIIHIHLPHPFAEFRIFVQLFFQRKMPPLIPYIHALPSSYGIFGKIWFHLITKKILNNANSILISNSFILDSFPILRNWQKKITLLPFYANTISEQDFEKSSAIRENMPFSVLSLGRLVPYKGYDVLLRGWRLFIDQQKREISCLLKIAGDGPEKCRLQQLTKDLSLEKTVIFLEAVSEEQKKNLFLNTCLFAAPSLTRAETFGIAVLEAMAHGLPVLTTNIDTGLAQLARNGDCGAAVPIGDPQAIANALNYFHQNIRDSIEIGKNNLNFVRENFSEEQFRSILKRLYASYPQLR